VTVLAQTAEFDEDIVLTRAEAARDRALDRLREGSGVDRDRATAALARAQTRIRIATPRRH